MDGLVLLWGGGDAKHWGKVDTRFCKHDLRFLGR